MKKLIILFDMRCSFCLTIARWLAKQTTYLELELLAANSPASQERYPELQNIAGEELLVIDDEGGVYRGSSAYIIVLYALKEYRAWSMRLSTPLLLPMARKFFFLLSRNRRYLSALVKSRSDIELHDALKQHSIPVCRI